MSNRAAYVDSIAVRDLGRMDRLVAGKKERRRLGEVLDAGERIESLLAGQLGGGFSTQNGAIAVTERRVVFASNKESYDWPFHTISYAQRVGGAFSTKLRLFLADGGEAILNNVAPADRIEQVAEIITERATSTRSSEDGPADTGDDQTGASPRAAPYVAAAQRITELKDADRALEAAQKEHLSCIEAARRALQDTEKSYSIAVERARAGVTKSGAPGVIVGEFGLLTSGRFVA